MRLLNLLPFLALALAGEAAVDAIPGVIAAREGGMGLGSVLVVGQVFAVAGAALGAIVGAYLVDRGSVRTAVLTGALLAYGASIAVGMQPMGALAWVVVALTAGGIGLGLVLTAAFAAAAALPGRARTAGILLLLLAPVGARALLGTLQAAGPTGLTVVAALGVLAAVVVVRLAPVARAEPHAGGVGPPMTAGLTAFGGSLVAAGVLLVLGGAEPSRVTAVVLADVLGLVSLEALDTVRVAMVVIGLVALAAGGALVGMRGRASWIVALAAPVLGLAAMAVAGTTAAVGRAPRVDAAVAVAPTLGLMIGLALGAWWLAGRVMPGVVATAGCVIVAVAAAVALVGLRDDGGPPALVAGIIGLVAIGGGLAAVALRLWLAAVPVRERGLAAAAGVVAASVGSSLGSMIGTGEAIASLVAEPPAVTPGVVLLALAGAAAAVAVGYPAITRRRVGADPRAGT